MPQVKTKAKLGASLVRPKSRGAARLETAFARSDVAASETEPRPSQAMQESGIFFAKGVASAAGFRPTHWTYDRQAAESAAPLAAPPAPRLAVLPGGAAEPAASLSSLGFAPSSEPPPPPRLTLLSPAAEEAAAEAAAPNVVPIAPTAPVPMPRAETHASAPLGIAKVEALLAPDDHGEGVAEPPQAGDAPAAPAISSPAAEDAAEAPAVRMAEETPAASDRPAIAEASSDAVAAKPAPPHAPALSLLEDEPAFTFRPPAPARDRANERAETISPPSEPPAPAPVTPAPIDVAQEMPPAAAALPIAAPVVEPPAPSLIVVEADVPEEPPLAPSDLAVPPAPEAPAPAEIFVVEPEQEASLPAVAEAPFAEPAVEPPVPAPAVSGVVETRPLQEIEIADWRSARPSEPPPSEPAALDAGAGAEPSTDAPPIAAPAEEPAAPVAAEAESIRERLLAELGAAIESVMSKRWYGMPTGTPLAPAAAMSVAPLPAVTHSALVAELAAAAPPPPAPVAKSRGFPTDILIACLCGGGLAFGYLFWGVPAPVAEAYRQLLRLIS